MTMRVLDETMESMSVQRHPVFVQDGSMHDFQFA